jgi:hypothetical protein
MPNTYRRIVNAAILTGFVLVLIGSSPAWRMQAKEITDPLKPVFCFDELGNCTGTGWFLDDRLIIVAEHDRTKKIVQTNWFIYYDYETGSSYSPMNQLTYGVLPKFYREKFPAKKLKLNTYYSVNGQNFFRIYQEDGKYEIEVFNDFLDPDASLKAFPR